MEFDYLIVGGGFFGSYLALLLKEKNNKKSVCIIEQESDLLQRASYNNQARIHNGYHYPRSLITALSSHKNFNSFVDEFKECVVKDFEKYYAISKVNSKVTASQFKTFCKRIGSPLENAPGHIKELFNDKLTEEVFLAKEFAFDSTILKKIIKQRLDKNKVNILFNTQALKISSTSKNSKIETEVKNIKDNKKFKIKSKYVFICTYSNINYLLENSGLQKIDFKQEMTEIALIKIPKEMKDKSVTMMCGPFFSFMPFPSRKLYSLSHVRYTPHYEWFDLKDKVNNQTHYNNAKKKIKTNYPKMIKDVSRYIPAMSKAEYVDSIYEIKTVLPKNENDDGRPIMFKKDFKIKNLICVLGGKLDNIYDLREIVEAEIA